MKNDTPAPPPCPPPCDYDDDKAVKALEAIGPCSKYSKDELHRMCIVLYKDCNDKCRTIKVMRWLFAALATSNIMLLVNIYA